MDAITIRPINSDAWMPKKLAAGVEAWNAETEKLNSERRRIGGAIEALRQEATDGSVEGLETIADRRQALQRDLLTATIKAVKHAEGRHSFVDAINEAFQTEKSKRRDRLETRMAELRQGAEKLGLHSPLLQGVIVEASKPERLAVSCFEKPQAVTDSDRATIAELRTEVARMI